jgi:hypothetical protein
MRDDNKVDDSFLFYYSVSSILIVCVCVCVCVFVCVFLETSIPSPIMTEMWDFSKITIKGKVFVL